MGVERELRPDGYYVAFSRGETSVCASRGWIVYTGPPRTMNRYVMAASGASAQGILMPGPTIVLLRCWKVALAGLALPVLALTLRRIHTKDGLLCSVVATTFTSKAARMWDTDSSKDGCYRQRQLVLSSLPFSPFLVLGCGTFPWPF